MRKLCSVLFAAVFAVLAVTGPAAAASAEGSSAAAPSKVQFFKSYVTGKCIDDSHEGLRVFPCNGLNYQKWQVTVWPNGTRELRNVATGRCIDDSHEGLRSFPCNRSAYQSWQVIKVRLGINLRNLHTRNYLMSAPNGWNELWARDKKVSAGNDIWI